MADVIGAEIHESAVTILRARGHDPKNCTAEEYAEACIAASEKLPEKEPLKSLDEIRADHLHRRAESILTAALVMQGRDPDSYSYSEYRIALDEAQRESEEREQ